MTRFTTENAAAAIADFRQGGTIKSAAKAANVSRQTLHDWIKRGTRKEEPYATFATAVTKARQAFAKDRRAAILQKMSAIAA